MSRTWREPISGWGGICSLEDSKGGEGGLSEAVGGMVGGRRGIVDVDNIEGRERWGGWATGRGKRRMGK